MGVLLVILFVIVPVAALGLFMARIRGMLRRAPFPAPVAPDLACPFCGHEMRHGRIMHPAYPLWWEPTGAPPPRVLSTRGSLTARGAIAVFEGTRPKIQVQVRGASICDNCEAVVLDPKV